MRNLKKTIQMNLFTKQKQTHIESKLMVTGARLGDGLGGGIVREVGIDMYTLLCLNV